MDTNGRLLAEIKSDTGSPHMHHRGFRLHHHQVLNMVCRRLELTSVISSSSRITAAPTRVTYHRTTTPTLSMDTRPVLLSHFRRHPQVSLAIRFNTVRPSSRSTTMAREASKELDMVNSNQRKSMRDSLSFVGPQVVSCQLCRYNSCHTMTKREQHRRENLLF